MKTLEQLREDVARTAVRVYAARALRDTAFRGEDDDAKDAACVELKQANTAHDLAVELYVLACRRLGVDPLGETREG